MNIAVLAVTLGLCVGGVSAQASSPTEWDDAALWADFVAWADALERLPPGEVAISYELYQQRLRDRGATASEAAALMERLQAYRRADPERERIYWDARFKLGGGPGHPLRLLAETVRHLPPGRALDVAMGRGRNGIFLASLGWDVTGYDPSTEALAVAQEYAAVAGVELTTVEAVHDSFDFGEAQWDLIVCSYAYMTPDDEEWPERVRRALRPGGTLVVQTSWKRESTLAELLELWEGLRVVHYADLDAGVADDEWIPSRTNPTVQLVLRKDGE